MFIALCPKVVKENTLPFSFFSQVGHELFLALLHDMQL